VSIERIPLPPDELRVLAALVVELTKLRQAECKHLSIEAFAPELWRNLLEATYYQVPLLYSEQHFRHDWGASSATHYSPR
jgi:hypothetical protein